MNPDTSYQERFEAALQDMLSGRHISQTDKDSEDLTRKPEDDQ